MKKYRHFDSELVNKSIFVLGERVIMKKRIWFVAVIIMLMIVALPFICLYFLNNGNPYTNYIADKYIPTYLVENGYTENDIYESHYIEPKNIINKDFYHGHYMVIFNDELDITYYYGVTKRGKHVKQFCEREKLLPNGVTEFAEGETKHSEAGCVKSLDNRN